MNTLLELYKQHQGKVSDKWSLYLEEYDRLFGPYRELPVRLLEIGVQNGGSLEIWANYFPNARKIVGCDINPDCAGLAYEDDRIAVVVGDANTDECASRIMAYSARFDLIVDDGSHTSKDIVKSFARYFGLLDPSGLYVAEDLHCSYWGQFAGGLHYPYSAIAFFKHLVDIANHEHWGIPKDRAFLLQGVSRHYSAEFSEELLAEIRSVEFLNSMCAVRKQIGGRNRLGGRFIAGKEEPVVQGHHVHADEVLISPDESGNVWATINPPPGEQIQGLRQSLDERDARISELERAMGEPGDQIQGLMQSLDVRDARISELERVIDEREDLLARLEKRSSARELRIAECERNVADCERAVAARDEEIAALKRSWSWKLMHPIESSRNARSENGS